MSDATRAAENDERRGGALSLRLAPHLQIFASAFRDAYAQEAELRRPFLWSAVAAGAGVVLYFAAEREPPLALCLAARGFLAARLRHPPPRARKRSVFSARLWRRGIRLGRLARGAGGGADRAARRRRRADRLRGRGRPAPRRRTLRAARCERGRPAGRRRAGARAADDAGRARFRGRRLHRFEGAAHAPRPRGAPRGL